MKAYIKKKIVFAVFQSSSSKVRRWKKLEVQMSRRFIVVFLSLSLFRLSFSSFSSQLLWFVLTVDWIVDRVKWNHCNDEAKWKPSTGSPDRGCALSWNPRICSTWKIVENHWKIHIAKNKNDSPCANRGDCVDSCSLTKSMRIDYKTLHRSLTSLIKSIDCIK